ncbi:MAG: hypothetical protein ACOXZ6_08390 [Syntrophomonadaceae bacterium]
MKRILSALMLSIILIAGQPLNAPAQGQADVAVVSGRLDSKPGSFAGDSERAYPGTLPRYSRGYEHTGQLG